ncbi:MAG: hypothetical protein ABH869_04560 [Candidatus Omnitrophota bacterium]
MENKGKCFEEMTREEKIRDNKCREQELEDEIRSFEKERENVRKIIGRIGGAP